MKRVVGISLGSPKRDHAVMVNLFGECIRVERVGTGGDMRKMITLIKEMDGKVDAFGLGGMDLYIQVADRRYTIRDAKKIVNAARIMPILDGSGLKNTLERRIIKYLATEKKFFTDKKKVLMVCAADRFGMAQTLEECGCKVTYGDLLFVLGLPIPFTSYAALSKALHLVAPVASQLPFTWLYPTGEKQEKSSPRFTRYFEEAEIIAGDYHFIRRYMPPRLNDKVIITNTVTADDLVFLRERGVKALVTTTPELEGRSFGTNVMEALLVAISGKKEELSAGEYSELLEKLNMKPRLVYF